VEHHAGIDVSLELSSVCVVDSQGKIVKEAKVTSEAEALVCFFKGLSFPVKRIGLEAGPLSQWLHAGLAHEGLVVRPNATTDDATPNANGLAAQNLIRLAVFTGQHAWREKADRLLEGFAAAAGENPFGHLALLNALDLRLRTAEIVVAGEDEHANDLLAAAHKLPFLDRVVLRASHALPASHPAQDKIKAAAQSAAFVCVGETCSLPVSEPEAIAAAVTAARP
jgi:uncharacterized protein YyaL (SSP411 family)